MRRRPPVTVVAHIALFAAILLAMFVAGGFDPVALVMGAAIGAGLAGLYFRSRIAWILMIAFEVNLLLGLLVSIERGNVRTGLENGGAWLVFAFLIGMLALLLAPPTRRYFRREPRSEPRRASRTGRAVKLAATVMAGLLLGLLGYTALSQPDRLSGDLELVHSDRPGLRVLFVGNSLTSDNSMTGMFRRLGQGDTGAPPVFAVQYARRGSTLEDAMDDSRLTELIKGERWDRVVLQEHSQTISRPQDRRARTVPAAIALDGMARRSGAKTVLFTNSGYERGDQDAVVGDTYPAMQARLGQGYAELASTLSAMQAPVGLAWEEALREHPGLDLWGDDGIRPSLTGSYLTACVFYAWLTRRDPAGNGYTAGLQPAQAQLLQRVAGESVRRIDPGALPRER